LRTEDRKYDEIIDKRKGGTYTVGMMNYNILARLSKYLFWDCDTDTLDPNIDRNLILERVFSRGTENDEKEVFGYYGKNIIKEAVLTVKHFDKKTLNYLSIIFNVSKEDFRCYKKTLLESPYGIS
jgi:hypothetical protein